MASSKSKSKEKRPGYVPKEGVFFDIKPEINKSRIWANGKPLPGVTRAEIIIDPSDGLTRARIELVMLEGRVGIEEAEMVKRLPKNAPWGVTTEEEKKPETTFKEKLQEKIKQPKNPVPLRPPHPTTPAGVCALITAFELGGITPFYDVTVTEDPLTHNVAIDAVITRDNNNYLVNAGCDVQDELGSFVASILPAGCAFDMKLHFSPAPLTNHP